MCLSTLNLTSSNSHQTIAVKIFFLVRFLSCPLFSSHYKLLFLALCQSHLQMNRVRLNFLSGHANKQFNNRGFVWKYLKLRQGFFLLLKFRWFYGGCDVAAHCWGPDSDTTNMSNRHKHHLLSPESVWIKSVWSFKGGSSYLALNSQVQLQWLRVCA